MLPVQGEEDIKRGGRSPRSRRPRKDSGGKLPHAWLPRRLARCEANLHHVHTTFACTSELRSHSIQAAGPPQRRRRKDTVCNDSRLEATNRSEDVLELTKNLWYCTLLGRHPTNLTVTLTVWWIVGLRGRH